MVDRCRVWGGGVSAGTGFVLVAGIVAALFAALAIGCRGHRPPTGLDSPLAEHRVEAIEADEAGLETVDPEVAAARRRERLARLIEQLDHDDAVVRASAIRRLERMTGETLEYRYDDPLHRRRAAVQRWVGWLGRLEPVHDDQSRREWNH